jgi:hypothetical protein
MLAPIGVSLGGQAGDLRLLHGERIVGRVGALARGLAGGAQLACGYSIRPEGRA